jgi:steroid delta-isomerase-like uncharacterized protein
MTRDEILGLLDRRADAWRRLDAETLVADYAEDAVIESPLAGGTTQGRDQIRQVFQTYFVAFPDLGMAVEEVLVDDQRAAVMATFTGTDRGGFMGMPATGRRVTHSRTGRSYATAASTISPACWCRSGRSRPNRPSSQSEKLRVVRPNSDL